MTGLALALGIQEPVTAAVTNGLTARPWRPLQKACLEGWKQSLSQGP